MKMPRPKMKMLRVRDTEGSALPPKREAGAKRSPEKPGPEATRGYAQIFNYTVCRNGQDFSRYQPSGVMNALGFSNNNLTFTTPDAATTQKIKLPEAVPGNIYTVKMDYTRITAGITAEISITGGYPVYLDNSTNDIRTTFKAVSGTNEVTVKLSGSTGAMSAAIDRVSVCGSANDLSYFKPYGNLKRFEP